MIALPSGTQIWIAAGVTDMRKGFDTLCALVQETLKSDPYSGQLFVFRGKRGDRLKILWWCDGGLCLYYKRLEEATFPWPRAASGVVSLSSAQLAMLLEGIEWRRPVRRSRPQLSV
jgi:transposase